MSKRRFVVLLFAALLAISGALYLSTQRYLPHDSRGVALIPAFAAEMNTVSAVKVRKGASSLNVHKVAGRWTVAERGDYPADVAKLRKLLLALSDAQIMEEKTSNPASYPLIGVDDPSKPGAAGAEITVVAGDGEHSVIVGKPIGAGNFVRREGDSKSYIVEPAISFETEPRTWIDSRLIDIAPAAIQSLEVRPATGTPYTTRRVPGDKPDDNVFALEGVPAGRKPADPHSLAPSSNLLGGLAAEDVSPAGDIDFSKSSQAIVTLTDGNVVTLTGTAAGDKRWLQIAATKDPDLSAKAQGRAFEIASYRYDAIFRPVDQLLVPKEAPAAKNPAPATKKPQLSPAP